MSAKHRGIDWWRSSPIGGQAERVNCGASTIVRSRRFATGTDQAAVDRWACHAWRASGRAEGRRLAGGAAAAAQTAEAAGLVEPLLLALGPEEPTVPQLAQDSGALHGGLEPLEQLLAVFTVPKRDERQITSPPRAIPTNRGRANARPSVNKYSGNAADAPVAVFAHSHAHYFPPEW